LSQIAYLHEELNREYTAPANLTFLLEENDGEVEDQEPPKQSRVRQKWNALSGPAQSMIRGLFVVLIYYGIVVCMFYTNDDAWSGVINERIIDAMYFASVTVSTVGYGDILPTDDQSRTVTLILIMVGLFFVMHEINSVILVMRSKLISNEKRLLKAIMNKMRSRRQFVEKMASSSRFRRGYLHSKHMCNDFMESHSQLTSFVGYTGFLWINIFITTFVFYVIEDNPFLDALYGSICTVSTVGYGDISFTKPGSRLFAVWWLLVTPVNTIYALNGISNVFYKEVSSSASSSDSSGTPVKKRPSPANSANNMNLEANHTFVPTPTPLPLFSQGPEEPKCEDDLFHLMRKWGDMELTEREMCNRLETLLSEVGAMVAQGHNKDQSRDTGPQSGGLTDVEAFKA